MAVELVHQKLWMRHVPLTVKSVLVPLKCAQSTDSSPVVCSETKIQNLTLLRIAILQLIHLLSLALSTTTSHWFDQPFFHITHCLAVLHRVQ